LRSPAAEGNLSDIRSVDAEMNARCWLAVALLAGRADESRTRECLLRVPTHNLMLLAAG
jgi:hypothetical protein